MPTNRGILSGIKPLSDVPDWMGGGDPMNDGTVLTADTSQPGAAKLSPLYGLSTFGDGSDGSPTFDGTTTILGMAPSSNVYTLGRDLFLASPIINSGVTLKTFGFRIFCSGTLTNNGTILWNGGNGAANGTGTGGAVVGNSLGTVSNSAALSPVGGAGTATIGGAGASSSCYAGTGGNGGTGTGGGGSTGGSPTVINSGNTPPRVGFLAISMHSFNGGGAWNTFGGGCSGGGGGGDTTNKGGGGGSGGGLVCVTARTIAGTGAIQARGGAGGPGTAGNTGGGGGGAGGTLVVVSGSVSAGAVTGQTIDANGGSGGNGFGTGTGGTAGGSGTVILIAA